MNKPDVREVLKERILVLDGAMGSLIQTYNLTEEDFRGEQFKNHAHSLKGNKHKINIKLDRYALIFKKSLQRTELSLKWSSGRKGMLEQRI